MTSIAGHLLVRAGRAKGVTEEEELQAWSLKYT